MKNASFLRKIPWVILLAFMGLASSAHSAPGDLYVPQAGDGTILKFSPDGTKSTFVSELDEPGGLTFDSSGNLFVSVGVGQFRDIVKITPSGETTLFAAEISIPAGLAFDGAGNLYVAFSMGDVGGIWKFSPDGTKSSFGSYDGLESGSPFGLAFGPLGDLYATIPSGPFNFNGGIIRYTPDGTGTTFSSSSGPGLAFDTAGNLYVGLNDEILKFSTLGGGGGGVFASGFQGPSALAFDAEVNLFVAEVLPDGTSSIQKVNPDGTKTLFASGLTPVISLAFEPVTEKLRNISARALVGTGDDALIGGFIVGGNALANNAVVVRAIGPSLAQAGVSNPLADPTLELHDASGALLALNDDWEDTQEAEIAATGLAPTDPNESAIYATLSAGSYTAVVRGADDTTGVALVEVYSVSQ